MPRWATWSVGVALVAAAWFVALVTPGAEQAQGAFRIEATVGSPAVGRNLAVTVDDVRRAEEITAGGWSASGNWVIVDLDAAAVFESGASLGHAVLVIEGRTFRASERPESLFQQLLSAGVAQSGSLAFELPEGVDRGKAELHLALRSDTRLDSLIVVPFDLAQATTVDGAELRKTGWSTP